MGSPDPDGRQIDGLGGGVSSLSKVALVGSPGEQGMEWVKDVLGHSSGNDAWDVAYRFGQVEVKKKAIDWSTTCGNLIAAVGHFAVDERLIPHSQLDARANRHRGMVPVRILSVNTGATMLAQVPTVRCEHTGELYAATQGDTQISGVPGTGAPVDIEFPNPAGPEGVLPTGNPRDVINVDDGLKIPITLINAGLPTLFVPLSSLPFPLSSILLHPSEIDNNKPLMSLLERIRQSGAALTPTLKKTLSPSAPKIAIVAPSTEAYMTTSGGKVMPGEMDLLARAISVGNVHRTFPATVLMAAAAAAAIRGTVVEETVQLGGNALKRDGNGVNWVRVGHPAGIAKAGARVKSNETGEGWNLESVAMTRTARRIMSGQVFIPSKVFE
ncbi:hypothetical protein HK104_002049 [Borealophlyctis nickersoniae]|nr:hypothetical protein HK104_002049 [Borealophlyctis nickersoniae]